jgi:hypothetical protein
MNIKTLALPLFLMTLSMNAYALVDYSETEDKTPQNKSAMQMQAPRSESRSLIWKSDFSLTTNYEALEINSEKVGVLNLNTHLQTPFNIYFDATYWNASTKASSQSGNPKMLLGFNWLRFGSPSDEARLDFYGGVKLPGSSELASSRMDKIFGIETTKRFGNFGLGLGYDMTLAGTPKKDQDMSIGNINRLTVSGAWMVSNDIQFEVEVENFKIAQSPDGTRSNALSKSVNFSTLSPKLNLTIAPAVSVELGARFGLKKLNSADNMATAKLFDLHGAYSNSLFAGLSLNL